MGPVYLFYSRRNSRKKFKLPELKYSKVPLKTSNSSFFPTTSHTNTTDTPTYLPFPSQCQKASNTPQVQSFRY